MSQQQSTGTPMVIHVAIIALGTGYAFAVAVLGAIAFRDGSDPLAAQAMSLLAQIVTWTIPALVLLVGGQTAGMSVILTRLLGSGNISSPPPTPT